MHGVTKQIGLMMKAKIIFSSFSHLQCTPQGHTFSVVSVFSFGGSLPNSRYYDFISVLIHLL